MYEVDIYLYLLSYNVNNMTDLKSLVKQIIGTKWPKINIKKIKTCCYFFNNRYY